MGKEKRKKKSVKEGTAVEVDSDSELTANVLDLGGRKDDLQLIEDINDDEEEIVMGEADDLDAEPINRDDIMEFINQLKIKEYRDPSFKKPEKESKSKSAPNAVKPDEEPSTSQESNPHQSEKKEKKKKGNKYKIQHDEVSSSNLDMDDESLSLDLGDYTSRKYLLMKTGSDWLEQSFPDDPTQFEAVSDATLEKLRQFAQTLYDDDVALYQQRKKTGKSDSGWMKTVVSSGTLGDKVAALTVMIQDASLHTLQQLDQLLAMMKKKGKRECFMALDNLKELFLTVWLPDGRKLRKFEEHPLSLLSELSSGNRDSRDRRLVIWLYEDLLKVKYAEFLEILESLAHDQLPTAKTKSISTVYELLVAKPEQEKKLLTLLVNKIGDPDHKIASKCCHLLTNLLEQHPNMKSVVTLEVERLLYRPNIAKKAQYYAICFLNQMVLSEDERQLAARLISVYFSFFKSFVKKGEVDSRMMSALLSGVNRAYPYAQDDKSKLEENMNTLYQVVHIVNFNTSIQALMLIYQIMDSSVAVSDRYYTSLYRKMLDPSLAVSSKQAMFLNLLFKTMKKDTSTKRIKAFIKRILQVSQFQSPTFACSSLILVAEVLKAHRRLLDLSHDAEESDEDEDEHFVDAPDDEDEHEAAKTRKNVGSAAKTASSWVHRSNLQGGHDQLDHYDPHHRNPLYTCADRECIWELKKMTGHYHPTVVLFATNILEGKAVEYPGDPLQDFTLIRFLDRFVYRNPKKKSETKAVQAKTTRAPVGAKALAVNSDKYLTLTESGVPADEKFFYKYFTQRARRKQAPKRRTEDASDEDSDAGSVDDDEFDDYLDKHEGQFEGDEHIKFDFAGEFSRNKTKKTTKKSEQEADADDDDDEDESADDLSDEEVDLGDLDFDGDDPDLGGGDLDEDDLDSDRGDEDADELMDDADFDEDMEEDADESFDEDDIFSQGPKNQRRKATVLTASGGKKNKKESVAGLFASAEEFSHLLEDDGSGNAGSSHALSNVKDKASAKQLHWEMERDRWLRDNDWRSKKRAATGRSKRPHTHKNKRKRKR